MPIVAILVGVFLAIAFLQSGMDKITDFEGNLDWLKGHFAETPLKKMVPMMLATVAAGELLSGSACFIGAVMTAVGLKYGAEILSYGLLAATITLMMLFFGQRMAKDYPGASTIAIYFGVAMLGVANATSVLPL